MAQVWVTCVWPTPKLRSAARNVKIFTTATGVGLGKIPFCNCGVLADQELQNYKAITNNLFANNSVNMIGSLTTFQVSNLFSLMRSIQIRWETDHLRKYPWSGCITGRWWSGSDPLWRHLIRLVATVTVMWHKFLRAFWYCIYVGRFFVIDFVIWPFWLCNFPEP